MTRCAFLLLAALLLAAHSPSVAQNTGSGTARHLRLDEAVQLALTHNHLVRIASLRVEEEQHAKEVSRSAYSR